MLALAFLAACFQVLQPAIVVMVAISQTQVTVYAVNAAVAMFGLPLFFNHTNNITAFKINVKRFIKLF